MPTYEYLCLECKHKFDIWQEVGSPAPPCENCQSQTKKVFQPPRIIFKGSGFYLTDLRSEQAAKNGSKNGESKSEKSDSGSETKSSDSKSESKSSDSKSESKSSESKSETKTDTKSDAAPAKSDAK